MTTNRMHTQSQAHVPFRSQPRSTRLARAIVATLVTLLALGAGSLALGQNAPEDARESTAEADGRVPSFEVTDRSSEAQAGVSLSVTVEAEGIATPQVVLAGPGGVLLQATGSRASFPDLPQGDYLVAATAEKLRMAYGTVNATDGEQIDVTLRLFDQRIQYADPSDTSILGIFTMDVADNVADDTGAIEIGVSPSAKMAAIGSDGYTAVFPTGAEARVLEGLEPGQYVVAMTVETRALAFATVIVNENERITFDVQMQDASR